VRSKAFFLFLLALLVLGAWAFYPGLSGGFLFDDYVNLPALGEYGGVRNLQTLELYLTCGLGDPLGRPLSLLSFLIDANTWPASPASFLFTNVCLHLINGVLLAMVLHRFATEERPARKDLPIVAVLGSAFWLLHPLQLSTVLYIVQREAILPVTCVLLAFLTWMHGRKLYETGRRHVGAFWLIVGAWFFTVLGTLCKANGVLIPALLLLAEYTVLRTAFISGHDEFKRLRRILLGIPTALVFCGLIAAIPHFIDAAREGRPWSLGQRLLTEPRVLMDYVHLLVLPQPISRGVFHDDVSPSTGLLSPWSTLPSIMLVLAAIAVAWRFRSERPLVALAIGFFLVGHILESSVVPLELYFEHRNYLPSLFLFWPLARWLSKTTVSLRRLRYALIGILPLLLAVDTHIGARTWGDPTQLALAWGKRNPESPRAQAYAAQFEIATGNPEAAERRLADALVQHPFEPQLAFNRIDAQCSVGHVDPASLAAAQVAVQQNAAAAGLDFAWLTASITNAQHRKCAGLDLDAVQRILDAARANPAFAHAAGRLQDFYQLQGLIDIAREQPDEALTSFEKAIDSLPTLDLALSQSVALAEAGRPDLGLLDLNRYLAGNPRLPARFGLSPRAMHAWLLDRSGYWQSEVDRVHTMLENASMPDRDRSP
jgi:protein O-mannosyl-transferase